MPENLFKSFDKVSTKDWMEKIRTDLKGKDLEQTVKWISPEGISVKPFYNKDDSPAGNSTLKTGAADSGWHVVERIAVHNIDDANKLALDALMHHAESIVFDLNGQTLTQVGLEALISGIVTDAAPVVFENYSDLDISSTSILAGAVLDDRLLYCLRRDTFHEEEFWKDWRKQLRLNSAQAVQNLSINATVFKDAGADHVQELAYTLAITQEYINHLSDEEIEGLAGVRINIGIAGNFFFEIAKLRALRQLWRVLVDCHGRENLPLYIESRSSGINKNILDPNSNMLRNTVECMAAVIGTADGVHISSHDLMEDHSDGRRYAANISHLLKNESYFDRVADPAKGAYYVESLTGELAERAWKLFQSIDKKGGFISCWYSGDIENSIQQSLNLKKQDAALRNTSFIGVNNYSDLNTAINFIEHDEHTVNLRLPSVRIAEDFESMRKITNERRSGGKGNPKICLFAAGRPGISKARMNYASNFTACAGLIPAESTGENISGEALDKLAGKNYDLIILCSDNDSWTEWIPKLRSEFSGQLWLAGNPEILDSDLAGKIDNAIYQGCNVLEKLKALIDLPAGE